MKKLFVVSVLTFLLTTPVTVLAGNGGGASGSASGSVSCTGEGTGQYSFTYVGHATVIAPIETATASTITLRSADIVTVVCLGCLAAPGAFMEVVGYPSPWTREIGRAHV